VQALRQCDGEHVQCLLLVRDDFWLATTRFLGELEVDLLQGDNTAVVDLFDLDHARRVLSAIGRALGKLPESPAAMSEEQREFLKMAVAGLAEDGKVICVRLALFAEMIKGKPWLPATWKSLGGIEGIGVNFLEETFTSPAANPKHRLHQKAARAVLTALLPESGTDIKGKMRSRKDLVVASGYADRPKEFAELMRILDRETRLITPTDPEGTDQPDVTPSDFQAGEKYYQLTHDYLVPSLRQWLTQERRRTWRGRAQLCLEERASEWSRSRLHRFLPSFLEYIAIAFGVPRKRRTTDQRALMQAARRFYMLRWGSVLGAIVLLGFVLYQYVSSVRSATRVHRAEIAVNLLLDTRPEGVSAAIEKLETDQDLARPLLAARFHEQGTDFRKRLHAAFALAAFGQADQGFLLQAIADAPAAECKNIVAALRPCTPDVLAQLRARTDEPQLEESIRVRYAIVLLHLDDLHTAGNFLVLAPDPSRRTAFIHSFKSWHGDLRPLAEILRTHNDPAFRSGMCAALGLIEPDTLDGEERVDLQRVLSELYERAPDGGTHSAAGWALRRWKAKLPEITPTAGAPEGRYWFVNRKRMTMLRVDAGRFRMGDSEDNQAKPIHSVVLTRPFFMCDGEVSVDQFNQFMKDPKAEKPQNWPGADLKKSPSGDCPVQNVNLFPDAVLFCNWLSKSEGREPCYVRTGDKEVAKVHIYQPTFQTKEVSFEAWKWEKERNGYRLPTEAEWEYACRAGSVTGYSFGESASLLPEYGVMRESRTRPGGSFLPNAWGLYMQGNVLEWCWDRFGSYPLSEQIDPCGPVTGGARVLRGGFYDVAPVLRRSGARFSDDSPIARFLIHGFRVVCDAPEQPDH
jgi:formylglycine-generating enzyme required for sulfatase activity